ncbi:MAG: alpha-amylase family glycosyl hydrolase [Pseudomonadota bacterium]
MPHLFRFLSPAFSAWIAACFWATGCASADPLASYIDRPAADEIIYFVIADRFENGNSENDTGGLAGNALDHGFDPTHKGFYHGGDLAGLTERLDYVQGLGATAIWLGPIYQNKPVQGAPGEETAGYHGYWITDFTNVDPHLGTREDLKAFVDAAHARNMKVYLDIVTNHTADIIYYEECHGDAAPAKLNGPGACPYRSRSAYPYTRRGGIDGASINVGFLGDQASVRTETNFDALKSPDYAYTPRIPKGEEAAKTPNWLNDPLVYHNRGDSAWFGENAVHGDFAGLDDLFTENPRVLDGFIEIYKSWITDFRIDGFRIDTAKHVNSEFWPPFNAAMLEHAASIGIPNFYIFGEVYSGNPIELARFTRLHGFPTVLDFGFWETSRNVLAGRAAPEDLAKLYRADPLYGDADTSIELATFLGNHDGGRFAYYLRQALPNISDDDLFARIRLGHALLILARGVPVIYYGDEQGFVGDGGDQDAREDMFPSKVDSYIDNDNVATEVTPAANNFDTSHPLYIEIAQLAEIYRNHPALRHGKQIVRYAERKPGLLALSRIGNSEDAEYLLIVNTDTNSQTATIEVDWRSTNWSALAGECPFNSLEPGLLEIDVPALDFVLCQSTQWIDAQ